MTILALDTSSLVSSVALVNPTTLLAELTIQIRKTHSEQLMPHIAQLLEFAGIKPNELEAIAVSIGPGSFTGLRIGLATAKAIAYAQDKPLVGVPTLDALAYSCTVPGVMVMPLLDAQKDNVYYAVYRWQGNTLETIEPAAVGNIDETLARLCAASVPVLTMGEAAVQYADKLKTYPGLIAAPPHLTIPRAANVGMLAVQMLSQGIQHNVMELEPVYIRRSEAEELWEKRHGGCG